MEYILNLLQQSKNKSSQSILQSVHSHTLWNGLLGRFKRQTKQNENINKDLGTDLLYKYYSKQASIAILKVWCQVEKTYDLFQNETTFTKAKVNETCNCLSLL